MPNGPDREMKGSFDGSVLFSSILLFLLCSFIFVSVLESYRLTSDIGLRTRNFYIAKSMKQMFLTEYLLNEEQRVQGKLRYTTGVIVYHKRADKLHLEVEVPPFKYTFIETAEAEN